MAATLEALAAAHRRYMAQAAPRAKYGADANPTGDRIGGGEGYTRAITRAEADVVVSTRAQLLQALEKAEAGDIVYVADHARIDLTGASSVAIPAGVTLASGRGQGGSPGGLIYVRRPLGIDSARLFRAGADVRITGLRVQGPHAGTALLKNTRDNMTGIYADPENRLEVDNAELSGWSFAAVMGSAMHLHHNHIHHNQQDSLGYGVFVLDGPGALIEANHFDYCRHAIANLGTPEVRYEARYNVVGKNMNGYAFDVHEQRWERDANGEFFAGDRVDIHHNTFLDTRHRAVKIRGNPRSQSRVHHNVIMGMDTPVFQANGSRNLAVYQNVYGPDRRLDAVPLYQRYQEVHYRGVLKNPR